MVGEGVVFQGMRGYTVPPHAPAVACFTMSVTQHIWLKKKYYRVPIFNPVVSEATRLSRRTINHEIQWNRLAARAMAACIRKRFPMSGAEP